jgi:nucleoid DNA-binding protein|tara:strand:+ start:415 stop:720 length:306 start_codon:yes stop_codon:yes gene_type:complete
LPTITKRHLASILAQEKGLSQTLAKHCVNALFQALRQAVIQGNRIEIRGFGIWMVRETPPRPKAQNPMTRESVNVPARRRVSFKAGNLLREELCQPTDNNE